MHVYAGLIWGRSGINFFSKKMFDVVSGKFRLCGVNLTRFYTIMCCGMKAFLLIWLCL